jgi:hypothetical protein
MALSVLVIGGFSSMFSESISMEPQAEGGISFFVRDEVVLKLVEKLQDFYVGLTPDQLVLQSIDPVIWNDASLGCPQEGHFYPQVMTPGYKVEFQVGNDCFVAHMNKNGSQIVFLDLQSGRVEWAAQHDTVF